MGRHPGVVDGDRGGVAPLDQPAGTPGLRQEAIHSEFADDSAIAGVLDDFVGQLPVRIERMTEALANGDYQGLQGLAHKLKGVGGMYGYPVITAGAALLERAARDRDVEAGRLALGRLRGLTRRVVRGRAAQERSAASADE